MSFNSISERSPGVDRSTVKWLGWTIAALILWAVLYSLLQPFADWVIAVLPVEPDSPLGEAVSLLRLRYAEGADAAYAGGVRHGRRAQLLLAGAARARCSPESAKASAMCWRRCSASCTPFCSCSAVPLFIGFVSAGVPLGVTFSFLIAAPMVNEVALGPAVRAGRLEGRAHLSRLRSAASPSSRAGSSAGCTWSTGSNNGCATCAPAADDLPSEICPPSTASRPASRPCSDIVGKVWPWIIVGIAVGAFIHGYVPAEPAGLASWDVTPGGRCRPRSLIGIPMYSNAAGIIPVVEALLGKGAALGTVLAFMMSVIALSLPEMIILRKVLIAPADRRVRRRRRCRHSGGRFPVQCAVLISQTEMIHERRESAGPWLQTLHDDGHDRRLVQSAADRLGVPVKIEKVTDYAAIAGYGIVSTPGIVIDGKVVHAGSMPKADDLARWLTN